MRTYLVVVWLKTHVWLKTYNIKESRYTSHYFFLDFCIACRIMFIHFSLRNISVENKMSASHFRQRHVLLLFLCLFCSESQNCDLFERGKFLANVCVSLSLSVCLSVYVSLFLSLFLSSSLSLCVTLLHIMYIYINICIYTLGINMGTLATTPAWP
jgi:hypothetical protein